MTSKSTVYVSYDESTLLGVSTFTASQLTSLEFERIPSLNPSSIYVIPRQWVHDEKLLRPFNGYDKAKKVLVFEINDGALIRVFTMGLSGLRATYFADVEQEPNLVIKAYKDKSLWRGNTSARESVFIGEDLPIKVEGASAYIPRDFAFSFIRKHKVYQPQFKETKVGGKKAWDMVVDPNKEELILAQNKVNEYKSSLDVPSINLDELPDRVRTTLEKYQEGIPQ